MQYIVEMQVAQTAGFEKRAQYYASKAYSSQLFEGDALCPSARSDLHRHYRLCDVPQEISHQV